MGPNETIEMNRRYHVWDIIHNPACAMGYQDFTLTMIDSYEGETGGYGHKVGISFPRMEMTDKTTGFTKKIEKTKRYENRAPVLPEPIRTAPFIKPTRPQMDAFGQLQPALCASSPLTSATWYWQSDDGLRWNEFGPEDSTFLESAYQNPMCQSITHPTNPWQYDFTKMIQTNVRTNSKRSILRHESQTPGPSALP